MYGLVIYINNDKELHNFDYVLNIIFAYTLHTWLHIQRNLENIILLIGRMSTFERLDEQVQRSDIFNWDKRGKFVLDLANLISARHGIVSPQKATASVRSILRGDIEGDGISTVPERAHRRYKLLRY